MAGELLQCICLQLPLRLSGCERGLQAEHRLCQLIPLLRACMQTSSESLLLDAHVMCTHPLVASATRQLHIAAQPVQHELE